MTILNVNALQTNQEQPDPNGTRVVTKQNELQPDDFIKLFLKQLTTQNPLKPTDSSVMLQQMADISAISAAKDTQKTLREVKQDVRMALGQSQFLSASQMIGKKVEVESEITPLVKDEGLSGSVGLPGAASNVKVTIKDDKGNVVKELDLGPSATGGVVEFKWDGMKEDGTSAYEPGFYHISAKATIRNKEVPVGTAGAFRVQSVASNQRTGEVILNVDGLGGLALSDIIKVL